MPVALYQGARSRGASSRRTHQEELRNEGGRDHRGINQTSPGREQADDNELRCRHDRAGETCRSVGAKLHGKRTDTETLVPLDGLEVVERHDAVRAETVKSGDGEDLPARQSAGHDCGAREPGQSLVAGGNRRVSPPSVLLEAERRRAVDPGQREPAAAAARTQDTDIEATISESAVHATAI